MKKQRFPLNLAVIMTFLLLSAQKVLAVGDTLLALQVAYGPGPDYPGQPLYGINPVPPYEQILRNPKIWGLILISAALIIGSVVMIIKWKKNKNKGEFDIKK